MRLTKPKIYKQAFSLDIDSVYTKFAYICFVFETHNIAIRSKDLNFKLGRRFVFIIKVVLRKKKLKKKKKPNTIFNSIIRSARSSLL